VHSLDETDMEGGGALVADWLPEGGGAAPDIERPPGPGPGEEPAQLREEDFFREQVRVFCA
jgi:hypothetical protein